MRKILLSSFSLVLFVSTLFFFTGCNEAAGDTADASGTTVQPTQSTVSQTADSTADETADSASSQVPESTPEPPQTEYYEANLTSYTITVTAPENPYDMDYQEEVNAELQEQLDAGSYTLDNPFACINPYGTSQLAMLIAFDDVEGYASYTINSPYSDSTDTKTYTEITSSYSLEVFGLYPDAVNEIVVDIYSEDGYLLKEAVYTIDVPSVAFDLKAAQSKDGNTLTLADVNNPLGVTVVSSSEGVTEGLFAMTGTISKLFNYNHIFYYDNDANLRGVIYTETRADDVIEYEDGIVFSYNKTTVVYATYLGETISITQYSGYQAHHDFVVDDQGRAFILVTEMGTANVQDGMLVVDLNTGEVVDFLDFKEFFGAEDWYYELNGGDWLHANSIEYIPEKGGNLIISSRELSMIFSITGADTYEYELEYVINEGAVAEELGLEDYNLSVIGDYSYNLGQHSVKLVDVEDEDHYQIVFFNNFSGHNNNKGSDLYPKAGRIDYSDIEGVNESSYVTLLDINTEDMTLEVVNTAALLFSNVRSCASAYQDSFIASGTETSQIVELDSEFNIVLEFALTQNSGVYECHKISMYDEADS